MGKVKKLYQIYAKVSRNKGVYKNNSENPPGYNPQNVL